MMQLLPTGILDSVDRKDLNLDNYSNYSLIGCLIEVSLHYPNLHNYYSLLGQKIKLTEERLSKYQLKS